MAATSGPNIIRCEDAAMVPFMDSPRSSRAQVDKPRTPPSPAKRIVTGSSQPGSGAEASRYCARAEHFAIFFSAFRQTQRSALRMREEQVTPWEMVGLSLQTLQKIRDNSAEIARVFRIPYKYVISKRHFYDRSHFLSRKLKNNYFFSLFSKRAIKFISKFLMKRNINWHNWY